MKTTSSRTPLSYIRNVLFIVVLLVVCLYGSKTMVTARLVNTRLTSEYFEENPRTTEEESHPRYSTFTNDHTGKLIICCSGIHKLDGILNNTTRSFEDIDTSQ